MDIRLNTYPGLDRTNRGQDIPRDSTFKNSGKSYTSATARTQDEVLISSKSRTAPEDIRNVDGNGTVDQDMDIDKTTFPEIPMAARIAAKYNEYHDYLKEHYNKVNEENKKFSNPEKHIYDKYYNKKSPYYMKDLSQSEREIGYQQETVVLDGGEADFNGCDPVIRKAFGGIYALEVEMECNQEVRDGINQSIDQLFKENGIVIPEDADLQLTVDPYDYQIRAGGVEEDLCRAIEKALNKGRNGYILYDHISFSNPANYGLPEPSQFSQGGQGKMEVYHLVDQLTGLDIRELENRDGIIYTPDGQDLWQVMSDKYKEMVRTGKAGPFSLDQYYAQYQRIVKEGWSGPDANLTIGYKNGSLYDIGTEYGWGTGQTAWQSDVRELFSRAREKSETQPEGDGSTDREEEKPFGLYGKDGTFYPMEPIRDEVMEKLSSSFKAGILKPLNDGSVMRIPSGASDKRKRIDYTV